MAASFPASGTSRKLLEHALLLIAREHGGDAAVAKAASEELRRWRAADSTHEAATQAALRAWEATEGSGLRATVALPSRQAPARSQARRNLVSLLGIAGLVGIGGLSRWYWQQPLQQLSLQARRGQVLAQKLDDGSRLELAPYTVAQAAIYRDRREVRLQEGEIHLHVHPDSSRPFLVLTDWGAVRVLGTIFSVSVRQRRLTVAVAEGRVAIWTGDQRASVRASMGPYSAELTAGQTLAVDPQGTLQRGAVDPADVGAWRQGWLVFDHTPLAEVVARWNDFLPQPLRLDNDPALRDLQLTGSFRLSEPAAFMASLPNVLPVRTARGSDGAPVIQMRR